MAIWQYSFLVLPNVTINIGFQVLEGHNFFDDSECWKANLTDRNVFYSFSRILPKGKSWSNNIDLYGDLESNCCEVFWENDNVLSVSFRINFTSNYEFILRELIEFCIINNLLIINEETNLIPLNFETINSIIDNSIQKKKYFELIECSKEEND